MESLETIANSGSRKLIEYYGKKLGRDEENITTFFALLDTIEEIMETKVRPYIHEWEEKGVQLVDGKVILPPKMESALNELIKENELYSFFIPEKHGGFGYETLFSHGLSELMTRYDIPLQMLTTISLSVLEALVVYNRPEYEPYIQNFMEGKNTGYVAFTEAGAGSHLQNIKATSVLEGDEYVLNGTKIFISNGGYANAGLFLARNMVDGKEAGTNVLYVEGFDGITTLRLEDKSGLHANPTAQLLFEDVRVPKENIIGEVGDGYRKVLERLMGMRVGVVAQGLGASARALELAKSYAEERVQFGKPIISFPGVSRKIEHMETQLPRLRAYGYLASYTLDRYYYGWIPADISATGSAAEETAAKMFASPILTGMAHYFASAAKLYVAEITNSLLYDAQQIFGGNGFVSEYEINKIARDVRVLPVYEGTSEIHDWLIGRSQQAMQMLPKFERTSLSFNGKTMYEEILATRFPGIFDKI
ncbi:MAG: Acyl-CoA dehydrogenase [Candidatus Heimdallarchaeota archaeon LC_2]|nr:MAG: Acyl-CoA dehydrogenase [Candidatus Heimdallarchaeota archaeon LC_2]